MKITVITVCYNAETLIEDTIKSVLSQTHDDIEYIVIDGKSTDRTMEIIRKYEDKITRIISEPDSGIYDAMNKGITIATGEYINFMNAGDTFTSPDVIKEIIKQISKDSDIVFGNSTMIDYNGNRVSSPASTDIGIIRKKPIYRHNASFTRTTLHQKYPFDLSKKDLFKHALDYNNIFTVWHNGAKFQKVDVDVVTWEKAGTSDRNLLNIKLMFKISHQFRKPTFKEQISYAFDCVKALRREIIKKIHRPYPQ